MQRVATRILVALLLLGPPLAGCGGDEEQRAERGLALPQEEAVPESEKSLEQTAEQRERRSVEEDQELEGEEFDAEHGGEAP